MDDCAATVGVATLAPVGLGDARATLQHRSAAAAVAATLAAATALALTYGLGHGPEIKPIVPVAAAVWSLADLLTATLLLAQFCINGRVSFAILSTAYAMSALLTWPFVLAFPGVIAPRPLGPGHQDVFVYFWMIWHCTFPLLVLASTFNDSPRKRFVSRRAILVVAIATVLGPLLLSGALAVTLFASRDALPQLVIEGRLQPLDRFLFHPAVVLLNLLACGVLARRGAKLTTLRLWLCVAMFSACLDSLLVNLGGATYSYAWDVGKIVADSTAFVVLCMILCELLLLYRQQLRLSEKLARDLGARERSEARLTLDVRARRDALYESERRYRSLAEALPHIVWTAGADGALDHFNQRTLAYTGKTLKELEGAAWLSVLHPGDVENARATWIRSVMEGTPYEIEFRIRRADGAYRWHLGAALPIRDATGSISKWFGTCTDIDDQRLASEAAGRLAEQMRLNETLEQDLLARERAEAALRASDERFQQVEAHSPIGLALVALDGRFMRVNPALSAIAGLGTAELLASTCRQLTHPDDFAADLANVERMLKDGSLNFEMEMRYVRASGEAVWVLTNCSLVRDDAGRPDYFIRQIQDISQRKIAEQELRVAETSALAAVEAKSRFLATMSHELRTPMNGIIGMTELLTLSTLSEDQSEYVKVVRDSGESLLRVLNDILDYSKIEAGKLDLEAVDFNLSSQIDSVVSLLERQYEVKGVALWADVDATLPASLRGDPGRAKVHAGRWRRAPHGRA
jgi:PAS domain S-box-containing protein